MPSTFDSVAGLRAFPRAIHSPHRDSCNERPNCSILSNCHGPEICLANRHPSPSWWLGQRTPARPPILHARADAARSTNRMCRRRCGIRTAAASMLSTSARKHVRAVGTESAGGERDGESDELIINSFGEYSVCDGLYGHSTLHHRLRRRNVSAVRNPHLEIPSCVPPSSDYFAQLAIGTSSTTRTRSRSWSVTACSCRCGCHRG